MADPRPIRWLHLSDLHCGCKGQELWEEVEEEFHRDLDQQLGKVGPPDLLLFTGDLAYSGTEYGEVDRVLDGLLERLVRTGAAEPLLLPVPGNHDVVRPSTRTKRFGYRILTDFDGTTNDPEVAEIHQELWGKRKTSFIDPLFPGYIEWFRRRVGPALESRAKAVHFSHFPCDYLAELEPEGAFPLAILGLNSTWIQYTGGDFDGKLLMPLEQYRAAVAPPAPEGKPSAVFERNSHTLLLMHQPPSWLSDKGREIFDASIYHPGRITACLYGHLHEANGTMFQSAGGEPRVFLQSPSLFGLKEWGKSEESRAFGYSWGQLRRDGELRIWPRELVRRQDGVWSFGTDPKFHEHPGGGVLLRPGRGGSAQQVAVEQRGIDLDAYLTHVISQTDTLEIRGIVGDRNQSAVCPPIENLYTPLRMRALGRMEGHGEEVDDTASDSELTTLLASDLVRSEGTVVLQTVLSQGERILIEGEPGAGKTTFLRLVACMLARDAAGQACPGSTSWRQAHLGLEDDEPAIPVLLRLAALVPLLAKSPGRDDRSRLLDLLESELRAADLASAIDRGYWQKLFEDGKAWLLLDGLDEVDDLVLRQRLFAIASDAIKHWPGRVVVASRPFHTEALGSMGFRVAMVEPFGPQEIGTFLAHWTSALYREDQERAARGKAEGYQERLEEAILSRPKVRALARNPVMLTCLCVVHWNKGDLPDVRSRVYEAVIRWLLNAKAWKRQERFGLDPDFAERALSTLALHAMRTSQGKQSLLGLDEAAGIVVPSFERSCPGLSSEERLALARRWLLYECEGSGVVEEVPGERLRFWHLTFQEFLAALELARMEREDWWGILSEHLERPIWRETSELFVTCLYDLGLPKGLDWLLGEILGSGPTETRDGGGVKNLAMQAKTVGTMGRLLQPLERCGYQPGAALKTTYAENRERCMAIFSVSGAGQVPIKDRIAAGEALGQGGDPRFRPEKFSSNFLGVGSPSWRLGKYPVTVSEYRYFVDEGGYEDRRWWSAGGWSQKSEREWSEPEDWDAQSETPNRPVVGVSWWEAEAYCGWLSDLRGCELRLPTQDEWEFAATHSEGEYPWGSAEPSVELANFAKKLGEGNIGRPTPVGVYPHGNGPYGHCDLAGNVWEWCLDDLDEGENCPLQGGSWSVGAGYLRSAVRSRNGPWYRDGFVGFRLLWCPPSPPIPLSRSGRGGT